MKRLAYIPQLDSFRFFAVLMVMLSHWAPKYNTYAPWGFMGVCFFFVLSGYLITANLLYLKASIDRQEMSAGRAFRIFYSRRTLRIFPLYYFVIAVLWFGNRPVFEGNVGWYLAYVPNFLIYIRGHWTGMLSHFWSLGVEEQFYLLWPLLIFFINSKYSRGLFIATILLSIGSKLVAFDPHGPFFTNADVLPWRSFDAFGIGALLAWLTVYPQQESVLRRIPFGPGLLVSTALAVLFYRAKLSFLFGLGISSVSFFLIRQAQSGYTGITGKLIGNRVFRYFGRISYGLYIYHNLVPALWSWLCNTNPENPIGMPAWTPSFLVRTPVVYTCKFALLVGIASLSWFLLEQPLIKLKDRFAGEKPDAAKHKSKLVA